MCSIARNTNYYRKNKLERRVVHICPYNNCTYETTGPKQTLINHVNAKHVPESERPFQCKFTNCDRGFAQKCLLRNHYEKKHNLKLELKKNRTIIEYHIDTSNSEYEPTTASTINRLDYYKKNPIIKAKNLGEFSFLPGKFLNANHIHYDAREGYIKLKTYNVDQIKNRKKVKKIKLIKKINKKICH